MKPLARPRRGLARSSRNRRGRPCAGRKLCGVLLLSLGMAGLLAAFVFSGPSRATSAPASSRALVPSSRYPRVRRGGAMVTIGMN